MSSSEVQEIADRVLARRLRPEQRPGLAAALRAAADRLNALACDLDAGRPFTWPEQPLAGAALRTALRILTGERVP